VLVDDKDNVTFKEKTMDFPIEKNKNWLDNVYEFNLHPIDNQAEN
jgi:hypothetical protein